MHSPAKKVNEDPDDTAAIGTAEQTAKEKAEHLVRVVVETCSYYKCIISILHVRRLILLHVQEKKIVKNHCFRYFASGWI